MVCHLGPPLAWWSPMKMSPFTFQTEFSLASDHSAWPPLTVREHIPPEKISTRPEPFPWRSLREHMVTWLWDVRGRNVLWLLFPVKRFKLLGYDKSLLCFMISIEHRNKRDIGGAARCGEVWWWSSQWFMPRSSLWSYSWGWKRYTQTLVQWSCGNKARKLEFGAEAIAHWGKDCYCCLGVWAL